MKIRVYCLTTTIRQKRFRHSCDDRPKQYANYNASRLVSLKDVTRSLCWPLSLSKPESRPCSLDSSGARFSTQAAPPRTATTSQSARPGSPRVATHQRLRAVMTPLTSSATSILRPVDRLKSLLLRVQNQEATIVWCNAWLLSRKLSNTIR